MVTVVCFKPHCSALHILEKLKNNSTINLLHSQQKYTQQNFQHIYRTSNNRLYVVIYQPHLAKISSDASAKMHTRQTVPW